MAKILAEKAIQLLQQLIAIPSLSKEETQTAEAIELFSQKIVFRLIDFTIIYGWSINILMRRNQSFY